MIIIQYIPFSLDSLVRIFESEIKPWFIPTQFSKTGSHYTCDAKQNITYIQILIRQLQINNKLW